MLNWERIARIALHPHRVAIVETMLSPPPDGDPGWSAKTLAPLIDPAEGHLSQVSYHLRALRNAGLVTPVGNRQVRGAMQTFYKLTDTT